MGVTVYGASDDLVEIDGDLQAEFDTNRLGDAPVIVALSDGTALRVVYTNMGVWRVTVVAVGPESDVTVRQVPEGVDGDDADEYSDVATVKTGAPVRWAALAVDLAQRNRTTGGGT